MFLLGEKSFFKLFLQFFCLNIYVSTFEKIFAKFLKVNIHNYDIVMSSPVTIEKSTGTLALTVELMTKSIEFKRKSLIS